MVVEDSLVMAAKILTSTVFVWVANKRIRTQASWLAVGVADSSWPTRVGLTGVSLFHTASNGVWTFQISRQASTFCKSVAEDGTLSVGSTRRWLAGVTGHCTWFWRRISLKFWKAKALRVSLNYSTSRIGSTRIWCALTSFRYCKKWYNYK